MSEPESSTPKRRLEKPYCWQSRIALDRINAKLGGIDGCYGVAVYIALCRLSSERKNTPYIESRIAVIAELAGLRYRKAWDILRLLESDAGVINITNPNPSGKQPNKPCTYTIRAMHNVQTKDGTICNPEGGEVCTGERASHAGRLKGKTSSEGRRSLSKRAKENGAADLPLGSRSPDGARPAATAPSDSPPQIVGTWRVKQ